jgi:CCR4-NOT transcription complex subunit 2
MGFGVADLQAVIKMTEQDTSMLALGTDLTMLGMNLGASESLHPMFMSPWTDGPMRSKEPSFQLPACYTGIRLATSPQLFNQLSDETLFYIFYAMPQDVLQTFAASYLFAREWRFHRELRVWLCRAPGIEPSQKTAQFERGTFVIFDPLTWKKETKEMLLQYDLLEDRKQMLAVA